MESLQGHFLVASPHLHDGNFFRSVVLMLQHDEDGAVGLVLNRETDTKIAEIWEMISEEPCDVSGCIGIGGPVAGPIRALHTLDDYSESEILAGVHLAISKENLNGIVTRPDQPIRLFSGYSGWHYGQLEEELREGGWLVTEATRDEVFSDPNELWERITKDIGRSILGPDLWRQAPDDPSMN